jgi:hypothetical protein
MRIVRLSQGDINVVWRNVIIGQMGQSILILPSSGLFLDSLTFEDWTDRQSREFGFKSPNAA